MKQTQVIIFTENFQHTQIRIGWIDLYETRQTHRCQESRTRRLVHTQQKPHERDDIVLDEGLVKQGVQHGSREDRTSSKRKPEHVWDVRASLLLALAINKQKRQKKLTTIVGTVQYFRIKIAILSGSVSLLGVKLKKIIIWIASVWCILECEW